MFHICRSHGDRALPAAVSYVFVKDTTLDLDVFTVAHFVVISRRVCQAGASDVQMSLPQLAPAGSWERSHSLHRF